MQYGMKNLQLPDLFKKTFGRKTQPMKVILSTGHGRLHLIQSAQSLQKEGVDVTVVTGFIPAQWIPNRLIDRLGGLVGRKNNLAMGLRKRVPAGIDRADLKSCSFSEFVVQFLFKLSSYKILKRASSAVIGWRLFGWQSRKYITDADVFHVRSGAGGGGAIEKARKKGLKVLVDHSIAHPEEMLRQLNKTIGTGSTGINRYLSIYPDDRFWKMVLSDCLKADRLVVNSDYVKHSFIAEGYPADKISVVQLGVNPEFQNGEKEYSQQATTRLIYTGGFGRRKGALLIIAAIENLIKNNIDFSLDIVGSVMNDIEMPEWFRTSKSIKLHGHVSQAEMRPLLLKSDIYIFPSYTEGAAQSVKEAMALGLPVITTRQSGAPVEHFENGYLIGDNDAYALEEAIIVLSKDQYLREKLGRAASKTIRQEHTWENYAVQMKSIYDEMIA